MADQGRNFRNFTKEIHSLNSPRKTNKNAAKNHISTNSQDSSVSSSFNSFKSKSKPMKESPVEIGGNVENVFFKRSPCKRQVFASMDVALGMVVSLKGLGIRGIAAKCPVCKLIHVQEGL